ncbi:MAG: hypothetical protein HUK40_06785 [Desulfobacter sp.]|nr:hypothetical protein [Desulfobacter sp.]
MPGDMSQLNRLNQSMGRIGDQHLGLDSQNRITQGSTNWLGRAVNWVKSALGIKGQERDNKAIMNHVIATIKETQGMGDRFADIAKGRLSSALDRGRPITGRRVSTVISDLVRLKTSETSAREANIKINVKDLCDTLCDTGDTPLMEALEDQMTFFGLGDRFGELGYAEVMDLRDEVETRLERSCLRNGKSPTPEEAWPVIKEACRKLAMNMVKESISQRVSTMANYEDKDSPLMKTFQAHARILKMEVDIQPRDLAKLAEKFENKLTVVSLYDPENLHPPPRKNPPMP